MLNLKKKHQSFGLKAKNGTLICHWTMDKIKRPEGPVWVMNHFFINPQYDLMQALDKEMPLALSLAKESSCPVWPLDPAVINYFSQHPQYDKIWYHRPYQNKQAAR